MMTEKDQKAKRDDLIAAKPPRGFYIEGGRSARGMTFEIGRVIAICELSEECVELKTHGGKIKISGSRLTVSIFEDGTVKVSGKATEVKFIYGKA